MPRAGRPPARCLITDRIVLIKGRVERKSEAEVKLMAMEATPFESVADFEGVVKLRVDARQAPATILDELKSLIARYPGEAPVELRIDTTEGARVLRFGSGYRVRADGDFIAEARALLRLAVVA